MVSIILKGRRVVAVERRHPWVFSGAIARMTAEPEEGDRVVVCDPDGQPLAYGHFQDGSIRVRLFHFGAEAPGPSFWADRLSEARDVRRQLGLGTADTNAYRLVHAEGDGLPGLIIDMYDRTAVVQCHSWGMYREREAIAQALQKVYEGKLDAIYCKSVATLPQRFQAQAEDTYLYGQGLSRLVKENGHSFLVDWEGGQKTGFFLDQRENRALLGQYAAGKTVLNTFCYTGGFSIYALAAGARRVDSVDVSEAA
ncbi:MAG: class I SAM-dependent rRNA methyltransferase, partial [Lewinella sp.]|nr:class I SAM-dependent rRNA methyltransferase [Lewinella sp.]